MPVTSAHALVRSLALAGATLRLTELRAEVEAIERTFPELAGRRPPPGNGAAGSPPTRKRAAADLPGPRPPTLDGKLTQVLRAAPPDGIPRRELAERFGLTAPQFKLAMIRLKKLHGAGLVRMGATLAVRYRLEK